MRTFILFTIAVAVWALNEPITDKIAVLPLSEACLARQNNTQAGDTCRRYDGAILNGPSPYPCSCLDNDKDGGCYPGTGQVEAPNPNANGFVDYTIGISPPNGFSSLAGMAFTDNTNEIFVVSKAGKVFHIDVKTQAITQFMDFSDQVHDLGDYGGLSIETHTNFNVNPFVYVSYVNGSLIGENTEFNTISFVRVMRLTSSNGVMTNQQFILGQNILDSNPLCSSSHAGGALAMGHDGSLFITLGEGSHFDTDVMDFGQTQARYPFSGYCGKFFPGQAMGSLKAQSLDTLGGKLIRVDPATGNGICPGVGGGFTVYNPYCTPGMDLRATRARIYAMGFRNPFSMNVRPAVDGETGPGVPYIGDVGLGSFEEVNAVTQPGLNFGWPCWEGPLPMGAMRDSPLNNLTFNDSTITRPKNDQGQNFSCPYVYKNVVTTHPTYYWSRYTAAMDGLYGEQYILGAGFTGNCVSGVTFYTGNNYPASFKNQVYFSDYGTQWIKSFTTKDSDTFVKQYQFTPLNVPLVDLETNPANGDICYLELLAGAVHCIGYIAGGQVPVVVAGADKIAGAIPLTITFNSDNSFVASDATTKYVSWTFGDNSAAVVDPNPSHTYTKAGRYVATLRVSDGKTSVTKQITIVAGPSAPVASITSPITGTVGSFDNAYYYNASLPDDPITFQGSATGGTAPYTYFWDIYMVHTNHYHPESITSNQQNFVSTLNKMGASSHVGERINFLVILRVTDALNVTSETYARMSEDGWGSDAPSPSFVASSNSTTTGQYIRFDASATYDINLDTISYLWDFGDGHTIPFTTQSNNRYVSHAYSKPQNYNVVLTTFDNWGVSSQSSMTVTVSSGYVQNPPSVGVDGIVVSSITQTMRSGASTVGLSFFLVAAVIVSLLI